VLGSFVRPADGSSRTLTPVPKALDWGREIRARLPDVYFHRARRFIPTESLQIDTIGGIRRLSSEKDRVSELEVTSWTPDPSAQIYERTNQIQSVIAKKLFGQGSRTSVGVRGPI
jgi:hypothetical protein